MNAQEIIEYIRTSEKKTPVKVYVWEKGETNFPNCREFPTGEGTKIVFGDWKDVAPALVQENVTHVEIENNCRNSAIPMLDLKNIPARIEPGAIIREQVDIGKNAVIMMGAILNIGAIVGEGTMIDMGAVLGGRATVGKNCHVGAGAVLAGVVEPASATPVIVEDNVLIGANAVVIEGCRIGHDAVVAAGAVVVGDVEPNTVVAGMPRPGHQDEGRKDRRQDRPGGCPPGAVRTKKSKNCPRMCASGGFSMQIIVFLPARHSDN